MPTTLSPTYQKQGLPPGTPKYTGTHQVPMQIEAYDVTSEGSTAHPSVSPEEALRLARGASFTWLNVVGLSDNASVIAFGQALGSHNLALEDLLQVGTRPKLELHDGHLVVVLKLIHLDPPPEGFGETAAALEIEHVGVLLAPGVIVTFQERPGDPFDGVRRQLVERFGPLREPTAARMLHAIVDAVVDDAYDAIEVMGRGVETLEGSLLEDPPDDALEQIQEHRRNALLVRRVLRPLRETTFALKRLESDLMPGRMEAYWNDVTDHLDQLLESQELYREMVMGMVDLHHTAVSNRLNDTMRVLTVISVIFLPLSFLAGLYGMNFQYMPELTVWWGYFVLLGVMLLVAVGMAGWFKWRGWF